MKPADKKQKKHDDRTARYKAVGVIDLPDAVLTRAATFLALSYARFPMFYFNSFIISINDQSMTDPMLSIEYEV
jgi:hypothetical protein